MKKFFAILSPASIAFGAYLLLHYFLNPNPGEDHYEKAQWMQKYLLRGLALTGFGIGVILVLLHERKAATV